MRAERERGQATVEFILVLLIALTFLAIVIQPNATLASNSVQDVQNLAKLRASVDKLVSTIQYVSVSGPGTIETIQMTIPKGGSLAFAGTSIEMKIPISQGSPGCVTDNDYSTDPAGTSCDKVFTIPSVSSWTSNGSPVSNLSTPDAKLSLYNAVVKNTSGAVTVDISVVS